MRYIKRESAHRNGVSIHRIDKVFIYIFLRHSVVCSLSGTPL